VSRVTVGFHLCARACVGGVHIRTAPSPHPAGVQAPTRKLPIIRTPPRVVVFARTYVYTRVRSATYTCERVACSVRAWPCAEWHLCTTHTTVYTCMEQRAVSLEPQPLEPEHLDRQCLFAGLHDLLDVCLIETTHLGDRTLVAKPNRMTSCQQRRNMQTGQSRRCHCHCVGFHLNP
jgi:hypothetical protein